MFDRFRPAAAGAVAALAMLAAAGGARAQGEAMPVYNWVKAAAPPTNAVTARDYPYSATCRAENRGAGLWVGSWDGSHCMILDEHKPVASNRGLQFLVTAPGSSPARWGKAYPLPAEAINAGDLLGGAIKQYVCSQEGGVGAFHNFGCSAVHATNSNGLITILVGVERPAAPVAAAAAPGAPAPNTGTGVPHYTWVSADQPPTNVVVAPEAPHYAVCRGRHPGSSVATIVGLWSGRACVGSTGGSAEPLQGPVSFLVVVGNGGARWAEGSNKRQPGDVGQLPPNVANAGKAENRHNQFICSMAGGIGWVYEQSCEVSYFPGGFTPYNMAQPTRLLIGTIQ